MGDALTNLNDVVPALLFLCAAVPFAAALDQLDFFESVTSALARRFDPVPVWMLWWIAALTTAVLNLDTTIVLLTPLYIHLARRADVDPLPLALVPLLLAHFASSFLPVSNLTTLIAADRFDLSVLDVVVHLGPMSLITCGVGWLAYRRRHPTALHVRIEEPPDRRALMIGAVVVAGLLVGFVVGPWWSIRPWMVTTAGVAVLAVVNRRLPWRDVPLVTALGVAAVTVAVTLVVPADTFTSLLERDDPLVAGAVVLGAALVANVVNNLPALFVGIDATSTMTTGTWAWLAGVNAGAVLLPSGSLAALLWWRLTRAHEMAVDLRTYLRAVLPIAVPTTIVAAAVVAGSSRFWV